MATEKWIAGAVSWTACFGSEVNSCASGSSVLSSSVLTNTAGDMFADVSFALGSMTTLAPNTLSLFLYPLNQDGSTYGDSQLTTSPQAKTPSATLFAGQFSSPIVTTTPLTGFITRIILPTIGESFCFAIQNNLGNAIAASANTIKWQTYNRQVV
jgi:hypothetical protein